MKIYFLGNNSLYNHFDTCTKEEILEYCLSKKEIGIDIETKRKYSKKLYNNSAYEAGLDPYLSEICMFQIGDLEVQFIIDARVHCIKFLKPILESETILKIGHNLKFEAKFLIMQDILLTNIWDTMIVERILYNGLQTSYSLKTLMIKYLGYKDIIEDNTLFKDSLDNTLTEDSIFNYNSNTIPDFENELAFADYNQTAEEKTLSEEDTNLVVDKSIRLQFVEIEDTPFTIAQIEYGAKDIITPIQIKRIQELGVPQSDGSVYLPSFGIEIECKMVVVIAKMEVRGIKVDTKGWLEMYEKNKKEYKTLRTILDDWVIKYFPQFTDSNTLFGEKLCLIDWQSSTHVIKLFKHLEICPKEKSKSTGKISHTVGAKAVGRLLDAKHKKLFLDKIKTEIVDENDLQGFILNYLVFKKTQQLTTTFGETWLRFVHPLTKRVHPSLIQLMNTGRMSSTKPNMQAIPNGKDWRQLFIAEEGNKLLASDYKSQEVRYAAEVTENKQMQELFMGEGHPIFKDDVHSLTATKMYQMIYKNPNWICDKEVHKKERGVAKALIFKIFYGGSSYTISMDLGLEKEEAEGLYNSFFDAYDGLKENFEITKKKALNRGWIELDATSKKRFFYKNYDKLVNINRTLENKIYNTLHTNNLSPTSSNFKIISAELYYSDFEYKELSRSRNGFVGQLSRASLNYRIQGACAFMTKIACILIDENSRDIKSGLLLPVHDEVVEEYSSDIIEDRKLLTRKYMQDAGKYLCKNVLMDADCAVGDYWIH